NITTKDVADMWVHEGFTTYSEALYVDYHYGKDAMTEYVLGHRGKIQNDKPIIGIYGVNKEGSGDMYAKGANLIHTIRQLTTDAKFKEMLRGLNKVFYHQTITSSDVEKYMSRQMGRDLSKIFDQYLRTIQIPILEYTLKGKTLSYRWTKCVNGFTMPLRIMLNNGKAAWIQPTAKWKTMVLSETMKGNSLTPDPNFYIMTQRVQRQ
ncbi:MAG: M1 family peptidase, partial [Chitinophagaceae bacterium]|nr:M1 family peptidase [Chitinophagaceae bacterium]